METLGAPKFGFPQFLSRLLYCKSKSPVTGVGNERTTEIAGKQVVRVGEVKERKGKFLSNFDGRLLSGIKASEGARYGLGCGK
jgi:hypothetical protein